MFNRKYVFETLRTQKKRKMAGLLLFLGVTVVLFFSICFLIMATARLENKASREAFFKKSPDLLVIFTGDQGRIPFGFQKALDYNAQRIYITGVYESNSVHTLLKVQMKELLKKIHFDENNIDVDYMARNTVENVLAMLRFIKENRANVNNVLIISSDYHIFRIKLILNLVRLPAEEDINFYYLSPPQQNDQWRNVKIISKEVFKTLKAIGFLMLWDSSSEE